MAIAQDEVVFDLVATVDDDRAFQEWYDVAAPRVYAYLLSRTGSVAAAEDLTQETFLEVVRRPQSFDGRADPVPWLIGVARHRLARHFQRHRRDDERVLGAIREIAVSGVDDGLWRALETRDGLTKALARLPSIQRAALMLRYLDDLSVRDVARSIGRSEDATESLIRRARAALDAALGEDDDAA